MNKFETLEKKIEDLQAELQELKEQAEPKKQVAWEPDVVDECYFLGGIGDIFCDMYNNRYNRQGDIFKTQADAQQARDFNRVMTKLRKAAAGFEPDWSDGSQTKYNLCYNHKDSQFDVISYNYIIETINTTYFPTEKSAQAALDSLTEDEKQVLFKGYPVWPMMDEE